MASHALTLLSTAHCTLCERALDLLASMPEVRGRSLRVLDIADDDVLLERYGARLPVLLVGRRELDWPFDADAVAAAVSREDGTGAGR